MNKPINLQSKFKLFSEHWSPKIIAELNEYQFKLVKIKGQFTWHDHENTDEAFLVIKGSMGIQFKDKTVECNEGEIIVVKKGVLHKPFAFEECEVLIIEPRGVINTGNSGGKLTSENDVWI